VLVRAKPADGELDVPRLGRPGGGLDRGRGGRHHNALVDHAVAKRRETEVATDERGRDEVGAQHREAERAAAASDDDARRARHDEPDGGQRH
jgi:hypothetical protein